MATAAERRFDELYQRYFREVAAFCVRRGSVADGYDAANEVFATAWRRIDDVPKGDAARPWLFVVAKRVLYRRRRSANRFRRLMSKVGSMPAEYVPPPENIVVQRVEYEAVLAAASQLSRRDREVLSLAAWEGLPHSEIADVLGCSIDAVDQRLHRAKKRLAEQYHRMLRRRTRPYAVGGEGS